MDTSLLVLHIYLHVCLASVFGTTVLLYTFPVFRRARTVPGIVMVNLAFCFGLLFALGTPTVAIIIYGKSFDFYWVPYMYPGIHMLGKFLTLNTTLAAIIFYWHLAREDSYERILNWYEATLPMLALWIHAVYYSLQEYDIKHANN